MNAEIGYKVDQLVCGNVSQIDLLQIFHCWYGVKHNPQKMVTLRQLFKFPDGEPGPGGKGNIGDTGICKAPERQFMTMFEKWKIM